MSAPTGAGAALQETGEVARQFPDESPPSPIDNALEAVGSVLHDLLYLPEQASTIAASLDRLQYFQFTALWILGFVVLGAATWFVIRYWRSAGEPPEGPTPRVEAPLWLELGIAGLLLGIFLVAWGVGFRQWIRADRPPDDALEVYVTGKQWVWRFEYPNGRRSAGLLVVPANRPVRLQLTSQDVIHSLFVPAFRLKKDAVPGRQTTMWFEATAPDRHQLLCAEYCGDGHSRMWGEVVVLGQDAFERWLEGETPPFPDPGVGDAWITEPERRGAPTGESLAERGRALASEHGCQRCHSTDGSPGIGPTWRGLYGSVEVMEDGDSVEVDPGYITESMMDPMVRIVAGYPPVMPTYQGQLGPGQTAAIVEFIRSLRRPADAEADTAGAGPPPVSGSRDPESPGRGRGDPDREEVR